MSISSIQVDRRRKGSGPVGRAEAPRRDTGGGQGSSFRPPAAPRHPEAIAAQLRGLPTRGGQIGGCGTIVILLLVVGYYLLSGGQGIDLGGLTGDTSGQDNSSGYGAVDQGVPQSNYTPPVPAVSSGQTWTIMLYQDADDQVLEKDIFLDLNEAERVGSSKNVNVVAQLDRYRAAYQGDGDWTSARRYYVTQDNDLNAIHSQVVQDLGEVDMSDGATLVDFVQWAAQNYPGRQVRADPLGSRHGLARRMERSRRRAAPRPAARRSPAGWATTSTSTNWTRRWRRRARRRASTSSRSWAWTPA